MSWFARLPSVEKQLLIYGVGGYSLWSLGMAVTSPKKPAAAPEKPKPAAAAAKTAASAPVAASAPAMAGDMPKLAGPNDPMVLFALQDIQSRLAVIEKALKL